MILQFDVGNTRTKWRLLNSRWQRQTGSSTSRKSTLAALLAAIDSNTTVSRIQISSVAGPQFDAELSEALNARFAIKAEFAASAANSAGVVNSYADPDRMGVDRWLAMLAAYADSSSGPVMVVDCGSAVTIDLLDVEGLHQGGFIIAGLRMQQQSLLRDTDRVRFAEHEHTRNHIDPGCSTAEAVKHGALLAVAGAVELASRDWREIPGWQCYLSGGDSVVIKDLLSFPVTLNDELVLDGLALALP